MLGNGDYFLQYPTLLRVEKTSTILAIRLYSLTYSYIYLAPFTISVWSKFKRKDGNRRVNNIDSWPKRCVRSNNKSFLVRINWRGFLKWWREILASISLWISKWLLMKKNKRIMKKKQKNLKYSRISNHGWKRWRLQKDAHQVKRCTTLPKRTQLMICK